MKQEFYRSLRLFMSFALTLGVLPDLALASHAWGGYHWARTQNPFTVKLGDNVSSKWDAFLTTTSSDWSASAVLNTVVVAGSTSGRKCRPKAGQIEVCSEKYGANGWLGLAQIWVSGVHITQATTKVNDTYFDTPTYDTTAWRNLVMCQEVGHDFGLAHQDENFSNPNLGSCMDYTSDPTSNQHPNSHDYEQLEIIYAHTDTTTTVNQLSSKQPPAMTDLELDGPGQWGRLVGESRSGRSQVYELDFGNGNKIVTHVTWAIGHERGRGGRE